MNIKDLIVFILIVLALIICFRHNQNSDNKLLENKNENQNIQDESKIINPKNGEYFTEEELQDIWFKDNKTDYSQYPTLDKIDPKEAEAFMRKIDERTKSELKVH